MKQVLQNLRTGDLSVAEVPETICKKGGVLVDAAASLISAGTEKMTIELAQKSLLGKAKERPDLVRQVWQKFKRDGWASTLNTVNAKLNNPLALGYSCAGVIREIGEGAEEFQVGERVACAGMNYASHAETVYIPKNLTVKIPPNVTFEDAAFVTLGAIALQGVRTSEAKLGECVAVIGLGILGLITVQILKAAGCRVIGIDFDLSKLDLARSLGADATVLRDADVELIVCDITAHRGADAIIITAATDTNDPLELAGEIARDRAIISMVGAVKMDFSRKPYYEKELQLRLSRSYGPGRYDTQYEEQGVDYPLGYVRWTQRRNMEEFLRLISVKAVNVTKLVSHRFPIAQAETAYEIITGVKKEPYLGILLTYENAPVPGLRVIALNNSVRAHKVNPQIQLGVIGAGNFAKGVLLPRLAKLKEIELYGIATATGRSAKVVGEQYGFANCTTDYQELLQDERVSAVLIATRHDSHARIVAEALTAGKSVYVEKPLSLDCEGLHQVSEAVRNQGERVFVGFNRRFSPLVAQLKNAFSDVPNLAISYRINAGAIPHESWIQQAEGGGRIIGEMCHFVDLMQYLTDADPVEVFAYASATGRDTLSVVVKFNNGSIGNINYYAIGDRGLAKERIEVFGGNRAAILDDFCSLEIWREGKRAVTKRLTQDKGFDQSLGAFVQAVKSGSAMPISYKSLALTTLTTFCIEKALRSGKPIMVSL
jgi:predicted dehydrogenase/threonine dehydrogenase-like Zn-dependent dehydrogenase